MVTRSDLQKSANEALIQPNGFRGVGGLRIDIIDVESTSLEADITDHFVEDNTAIQDHIINKPKVVTINGLIGEFIITTEEESPAIRSSNRLQTVDLYEPQYTDGVKQSQRGIEGDYQGNRDTPAEQQVNQDNAYSQIQTAIIGTGQEKAYNFLKALRDNKLLTNVLTRYEYMQNMVIQSLAFSNRRNSLDVSEVAITLKQIRFANVASTQVDAQALARADAQRRAIQDNGKQSGQKKPFRSFLKRGVDAL